MTQLADHPSASILQPSLAMAVRHHQAGRLADAEVIYREILSQQPNQPDVLHLLGALCGQNGQADLAIELVSRAISLKPDAIYYDTLARSLKSSGRLDDAIAAYRLALRLKPDFAGRRTISASPCVPWENCVSHRQRFARPSRSIRTSPKPITISGIC